MKRTHASGKHGFQVVWHDQNLQVNGDKNHGTILGT